MAKLDLLKLAEQVSGKTYKEVELSFGKVRVYEVPEPMIWTYKPKRPRPVQPTVSMRLATGGSQSRPVKPGDEGYDEWRQAEDDYDEELSDIRMAARYTLALRDIEYPDLSQPPPLLAQVNGEYPADELMRKKVWLDHTVLAKSSDMVKIQAAMMALSADAPEDGTVEEIKKNSDSDTTDGQ